MRCGAEIALANSNAGRDATAKEHLIGMTRGNKPVIRLGGGLTAISVLLPWLAVTMSGCGLQRTVSFTGVQMVTSLQSTMARYSSSIPSGVMTDMAGITVAVILVVIGGLIGLAGSGYGGVIVSGMGLLGIGYLASRFGGVNGETMGAVQISYGFGFWVAAVGSVLMLLGEFIPSG
jgi:hypothetical protein